MKSIAADQPGARSFFFGTRDRPMAITLHGKQIPLRIAILQQ
jgi:hypothetical protein